MTDEELKLYRSLGVIALDIVTDLVRSRRPDPVEYLEQKRSEIQAEIQGEWADALRDKFGGGQGSPT